MMSASAGIDHDLHHVAYDTALTAKIMAKRRAEMERRAKLLNPKTRQHGANHAVLEAQIAEKRAAQDREMDEEDYHSRAALMQEQVAQTLETLREKGVRERQTAAISFSLHNLRRENRREYDLSDPNELKNERVLSHAELNQMGPSSCLTLGEDPEAIARTKHEQKMATREWLNQQKEERLCREIMEREIDREFDKEMQFANHVRHMCEQAATQEARDELLATVQDNHQIAEEHRQRRFAEAQKNCTMNKKHASSINNSDQLKETHDYQIGSNGKLVRTEYRRASMDERQDVHNTNAFQILEKQRQKEAEKAEDRAAKRTMDQDVAVREAIEQMRNQATLQRRMNMEEHNRNMIATRVYELTREGVRDD